MLNTLGFSSIQPSLGSNIYYLSPQRLVNLLILFQDRDTLFPMVSICETRKNPSRQTT